MDSAQNFVLDLGWIFFVAWGMVLAALSVIAFGPDLVPSADHPPARKGSA